MEVPTGFVKIWHGASKTQADATVIVITTLTMITAEIIMIGAYINFNHFFRRFIDSKEQRYYYYFWAAQVLVVAILFIFLPVYLSERQHNIVIVPYIYLMSAAVDCVFALCVCFYLACSKEGRMLPVPLSTFPYCKILCHYCCPCCTKVKDKQSVKLNDETQRTSCLCTMSSTYQFLMNVVCHTSTFFLVSYVVQSLPNVLIAYYAYPTRALIRLSFIQIALVCLLLSIATLIDLLETLSWQCYIWYYKKAPKEIKKFKSAKTIEEESNSRIIQITETQDAVIVGIDQDEVEVLNKTDIIFKNPLKSICTTIGRIIVIMMILAVLSIVLIIIGTIVFKQTEDNDTIKGLLTILPTILGNIIIFITKKKLFHPKDLKIELKKDE